MCNCRSATISKHDCISCLAAHTFIHIHQYTWSAIDKHAQILAFILQMAITLPRTEGQRFFRLIGCMLKSRPQSDGETVFKSHDAEVAWSAQAHFVQLEGCMYITCRKLFSLSDMNRCSNSAIDVARRCGYVAIASQKKWWMLFHTSTAGVFMWIYNVFFWSPSDLLLFGICTISFPFWLCLRNTLGVPKKDFRLAPKSWHRCVQFHVYSHKLYKSHTLPSTRITDTRSEPKAIVRSTKECATQ